MPCNYKDYPKNWKDIRSVVLKRAKGQCEFDLGSTDKVDLRCPEQNGSAARHFRGMVVLTIAHLCHVTKCDNLKHLKAMCQLHHLRLDAPIKWHKRFNLKGGLPK